MEDTGDITGLAEELRLSVASDLIRIRDRVIAGEIRGLDITEIHKILDNVNALANMAEDFEMISSESKC